MRFAVRDGLKNRREFMIGVITVLLVVAVISLLQNAIVTSSGLFVRLSETQVGEQDILLLPDVVSLAQGGDTSFWLNETELEEAFQSIPGLRGTAPRWTLLGRISKEGEPENNSSTIVLILDSDKERRVGIGKTWPHRSLNKFECYVSEPLLRQFGVLGGRGQRIRLGLDIESLTGALGLNTDSLVFGGGTVNVTNLVNISAINSFFNISLPASFEQPALDGLQTLAEQLLNPSALLTVVAGVLPDGKYPAVLGNVVILEKAWLPELLGEMFPAIPTALRDALDGVDNPIADVVRLIDEGTRPGFPFEQYAFQVIAMLEDREIIYSQTTGEIKGHLIRVTNAMFETLGFEYPALVQTPLISALDGVAFVRLFLEQIFGSVMALLVVLGAMLIYSLLLGNVNQRTYEYGMLRALGLERSSLVSLLIIVAIMFTIPGISFGLLGAWMLNVPVNLVLQVVVSAVPDFGLNWTAILIGIAVGVAMPMVSNLIPIRRALGKTLRDSLDVYHQSSSETSVQVVKLQSMGFSAWQMIISVIMVITGFLVYYMVPLSFTFQNFGLFLGILNVILMGMLLGLCLIATTIQPMFQRAVLWCIVWGRDRRLHHLVTKNLGAHHSRNQKTALMFTISMAFIIFAGASFSLQSSSIRDTIRTQFGSDVYVRTPSWNQPLPEADLRRLMEQKKDQGIVLSYAFTSYSITSHPLIDRSDLGNLAASPTRRVSVITMDREYLDAAYTQFFLTTEVDTDFVYSPANGTTQPDLVRSLYDDAGDATLPIEQEGIRVPLPILAYEDDETGVVIDPRTKEDIYRNYTDAIMSEAMRPGASVAVDSALRLQVRFVDGQNRRRTLSYLSKARGMVSKMPGFLVSSYEQTSSGSPMIVTRQAYRAWMDAADRIFEITRDSRSQVYNRVEGIPMQVMLAKLRDGASLEDREGVINAIRNFVPSESIQVVDTKTLVDTTSSATDAMLVFFNVVAVINSVLAFFLLWLSFDANVRENSWEFGVLRAIGVSSRQVLAAYIYEALSVVVASLILGSVIGMVVSITLTLQFGLFVELPFQFLFPTVLFCTVTGISIIVAILGAYLPAEDLRKKSVADVLRGKK